MRKLLQRSESIGFIFYIRQITEIIYQQNEKTQKDYIVVEYNGYKNRTIYY